MLHVHNVLTLAAGEFVSKSEALSIGNSKLFSYLDIILVFNSFIFTEASSSHSAQFDPFVTTSGKC